MSDPAVPAHDELFDSLLGDFLDESSQLLGRLNENLLQLDHLVRSLDGLSEASHQELLNEMFRAAHSLKGLSAMLGLSDINSLTHKVENVLDAARRKELHVTEDVVELVFRAVDCLEHLVETLKNPGAPPVESRSVAEEIARLLRQAGVERQQSSQADAERALQQPASDAGGDVQAAISAPSADSATADEKTGGPAKALHPVESPLPVESVLLVESVSPVESAELCAVDQAMDQQTSGPTEQYPAAQPAVSADLSQGSEENYATPPAVDYFADLTDETETPSKYLAIFIDEADLSLDQLTETLLALEEAPSRETVEQVMIIAHRIKGSAASVGLNRPAKLAHLMEDLLQKLLNNNQQLTPKITDALLMCADGLRQYIDGLKRGRPSTERFNYLTHELLAASAEDQTAAIAQTSASAPPTQAAPVLHHKPEMIEQVRASVAQGSRDPAKTYVGLLQFEARLPLAGLKARLVYEKLARMGEVCYFDPPADKVEEQQELEWVAFGVVTERPAAEVQSKLRVAGVRQILIEPLAFSAQPQVDRTSAHVLTSTESAHTGAAVTDLAQAPTATATIGCANSEQAALATAASGPQTGAQTDWPTGAPTRGQAGAATTAQTSTVFGAASGAGAGAAPGTAPASAMADAVPAGAPASARGRQPEAVPKAAETLRVDIERLDQLMNLAGQLVINKARFTRIGDRLKNALAARQSSQAMRNVLGILEKIANGDTVRGAEEAQFELEHLRAEVRRAQNELEVVQRDVESLALARSALNDYVETVHQLELVTDSLQHTVMDTRMLPIGPLFHRFKRVVRDLSRASGKTVNLVLNGEKTELDKRMIDELNDPLIHMVRNAVDHGIEPPEVRVAAGKPPHGTVTLDAFHRGNSIVIQVSDDGKGLDADRIARKALEKGLVTEADLEKMTRRQIYQLIWEPGLSTAEKVTEVSGRGMGMDIVRSKIEQLNGTVELDSQPGKGTCLTIKLPLTLAILPSLLVEIDGDVLAMPIEGVVEIVRLNSQELQTVHGVLTARVRGRVISVVHLRDVYHWARQNTARDRQSADCGDAALVIVGEQQRELGLAVDRVIGEEDIVIKSVAENYRNVPGIAGASILGDGRVALILDLAALIDMASLGGARQKSANTSKQPNFVTNKQAVGV